MLALILCYRVQDEVVCTHHGIFSAMGKKEIPPFVTIWTGLVGIMLSGISQRKTSTVCYHLYVESKEVKLIKTESRIGDTRGWGWGNMRGVVEGCKLVTTS